MIQLAMLIFAACLSLNAHADLTMEVKPASPIVFDSDLTFPGGGVLAGPWFSSYYSFSSDKVATIFALKFKITTVEGAHFDYTYQLPASLEVPAGKTVSTDTVYIGSLLQSRVHTYNVEVSVIGFYGAKNDPSDSLSLSTTFQTQ